MFEIACFRKLLGISLPDDIGYGMKQWRSLCTKVGEKVGAEKKLMSPKFCTFFAGGERNVFGK